jgi:hypothetical protein
VRAGPLLPGAGGVVRDPSQQSLRSTRRVFYTAAHPGLPAFVFVAGYEVRPAAGTRAIGITLDNPSNQTAPADAERLALAM